MLPHFDRPSLPVPGRRPADSPDESGHGVDGERRNNASASFGDAIARAQRDAVKRADGRTAQRAHSHGDPERRASDDNDLVRDPAKPRRTERAQSRDAVQARADSQPPTSSPAPDDTAEAAAAAGSSPDALIAGAQGTDLEPRSAVPPEQVVTAQLAPTAMAPATMAPPTLPDGAPLTVATGPSDHAAVGGDPVAQLPPTAATLAPPDASSGSSPATAERQVDTQTRLTPAMAPGTAADQADPSAALAEIRGQPAGDDSPAAASRAPQDAFARLSAATAEHLPRAEARLAPGTAPGVADDATEPSVRPVDATSNAEATAGTPVGDTGTTDASLQQATVATARHASGDTTAGPVQPGAGAPAGAPTAAGAHAQPASAPVAQPAVSTMPTPLAHPAFAGHFAAEVASLAFRGIGSAEIVLNPQELGPVRIELTLNGETARIAFTAAQPETRHAIEQTLPLLEDMLADHGLLLSGTSVSDGHAGRGSDGKAGSHGGDASPAHESRAHASSGSFAGKAGRAAVPKGLLDLYA
jgi:flagellar hook-length control protein FliK